MADTRTSSATRRGFLRFLALAPATAAVAPVSQSSASAPPPGRRVSKATPMGQVEVRKRWEAMEWEGDTFVYGRHERPLDAARADWEAVARNREGNRHD